MKKNVFTVLLLVLCMGTSFAQEQHAPDQDTFTQESPETRKNSVAIDLFPLFKGFVAYDKSNNLGFFCIAADYERLVVPHFSIGAALDLYFAKYDDINGFYFSLNFEGRYYPQSENFEKFFLGPSLGFSILAMDGKVVPENGGTGLMVSLKAGYKLITSINIYMEPSISYVLSKSTLVPMPAPLGLQGGFRFGFVF